MGENRNQNGRTKQHNSNFKRFMGSIYYITRERILGSAIGVNSRLTLCLGKNEGTTRMALS